MAVEDVKIMEVGGGVGGGEEGRIVVEETFLTGSRGWGRIFLRMRRGDGLGMSPYPSSSYSLSFGSSDPTDEGEEKE